MEQINEKQKSLLKKEAIKKISGDNEYSDLAMRAIWVDGAQSILSDPQKWGLVTKEQFDTIESNYDFFHVKSAKLEEENEILKTVLEDIADSYDPDNLNGSLLKDMAKQVLNGLK